MFDFKSSQGIQCGLVVYSWGAEALCLRTCHAQTILLYYLDNWDSIDFDDKRKAADGLISIIKATSDRVQIEWKI